MEDLKKELSESTDQKIAIDISAHAYRQVSERICSIAMESTIIWRDVFRPDSPNESLLVPSNLKSFLITLMANAYEKKQFHEEDSRNTNGGKEIHYTVEIKKWSDEKILQFVGIVENHTLKTAYFNWI